MAKEESVMSALTDVPAESFDFIFIVAVGAKKPLRLLQFVLWQVSSGTDYANATQG